MPWQPIYSAPKDGRRIVVAGGLFEICEVERLPQRFPSMVMWDGENWRVCDNDGVRSIIRRPKWWMEVPVAPEA